MYVPMSTNILDLTISIPLVVAMVIAVALVPFAIFLPNHIPRHAYSRRGNSGSHEPIQPPTPRLLPELTGLVVVEDPVQQVDDKVLAIRGALVVQRVFLDDAARWLVSTLVGWLGGSRGGSPSFRMSSSVAHVYPPRLSGCTLKYCPPSRACDSV